MRRLKEAGADCVKILLTTTRLKRERLTIKNMRGSNEWVRISAHDIPFFLELVGYEDGADAKSLEYARKKPRIVQVSTAEFTKSQYLVDILKVEIPFNLAFVEGTRAFSGTKPMDGRKRCDCCARPLKLPPSLSFTFRAESAMWNLSNRSSWRRKSECSSMASLWAGNLEGRDCRLPDERNGSFSTLA